ncbi:MAG: hypothetical protein ACLUEV_03045 [Alistipes sp.]
MQRPGGTVARSARSARWAGSPCPCTGDLGWSGVHAGKLDWVAGRNRSVFALAIGCQF